MTLLQLLRQPSRYLVVGAVCALLNNLILIGGDAAGLHYIVSMLLTFILVLPLSYLAHAFWTFEVARSWQAFGRFLFGSLSGLLTASLTIWLLYAAFRLPMIVAAPLATLTMTIYNFVMARWAIGRSARTRFPHVDGRTYS